MEMQLNSLINKIKQDGIIEAKKKAEEIIGQAEEKKKAVLQEAEGKARLIIKEAEERAERIKDNSQKAIAQAVRDVTLSLKDEIKNLFGGILKKEIQHVLSDDVVKEVILRIAEGWSKDREAGFEVSLSQQDKGRIEKLVLSKLKGELASGITFKVNPNINKGLYVSKKGEDFHYDFTDEAILEILKEYLRPLIVKIIEKRGNG